MLQDLCVPCFYQFHGTMICIFSTHATDDCLYHCNDHVRRDSHRYAVQALTMPRSLVSTAYNRLAQHITSRDAQAPPNATVLRLRNSELRHHIPSDETICFATTTSTRYSKANDTSSNGQASSFKAGSRGWLHAQLLDCAMSCSPCPHLAVGVNLVP